MCLEDPTLLAPNRQHQPDQSHLSDENHAYTGPTKGTSMFLALCGEIRHPQTCT